jgi:hypothetical protein
VHWSSPLFSQHRHKNVLLVSTLWQLQFAVLEMSLPALDDKPGPHWLKLTLLNYHFTIASPRAQCLTEGDREFFYVDENGQIVRVTFERNNTLGKIFNGDRYKEAAHTAKNSLSSNYFYVSRKASFLDKIKHYSRVITTNLKNVFKKKPELFGLVYDTKRQLLFSLIDTFP